MKSPKWICVSSSNLQLTGNGMWWIAIQAGMDMTCRLLRVKTDHTECERRKCHIQRNTSVEIVIAGSIKYSVLMTANT